MKGNDTRFFAVIGSLFSFCMIIFMSLLFRTVRDPMMRALLAAFFLIPAIAAVFFAVYLRKKVSYLTDSTCEILDHMIAESSQVPNPDYSDTLTAKLQERLHQFNELMLSRKGESLLARQEVQEFVSDISHQVKTPLANLKMYTGILQQREMTEEKRINFLALMEAQISKLDFLMQSMIKISRLEIGMITLQPEKCNLPDTIARALEVVWLKAEKKDIQIEVDCEGSLFAKHDKKWTSEAIFNLLDNAVKYTPPKGVIKISVKPWQFYTRINISDTGKGIDSGRYNDIFKRFYREPEVAEEEGVGLGLYLVREILTLQGGYISVKSAAGRGSTFSVYLLNE